MTVQALQTGSTIGEHELVRKLGEGAMGTVYEGRHRLIGKRVAIKVLKASDEDGRVAGLRFLEEARAVNAIDHKGIIDIFDAGALPDGRPYLVMELLVGRTLHDEVKRARAGLPLRLVFHVLRGVLDALSAAHRAGVIHRDLKASNVFLVEQAEGLPLVKLVDFGVARRQDRREALTLPSMTVGSMGFMAPEHIAGRPVPQSDLYACGCLAWLMLTGKPVFPYGNLPTLVNQHLKVVPPGVGTVRAETPPELEAFVAWLLEKRPKDRPHSAEVALTVLREAEQSGDGLRTVPGGPAFIELARSYDAGVRRQAERAAAGLGAGKVPTTGVPAARSRGAGAGANAAAESSRLSRDAGRGPPASDPPGDGQGARARSSAASRVEPVSARRVLTASRRASDRPPVEHGAAITSPEGLRPVPGPVPRPSSTSSAARDSVTTAGGAPGAREPAAAVEEVKGPLLPGRGAGRGAAGAGAPVGLGEPAGDFHSDSTVVVPRHRK
ncbi:MAG: serine/threonine protein kinase [Myxococcaceae bacterium]|jgi:tRNA A-37 threonylcarbamoyl transferase component Bud32|nr:serine/threonine protein kinase [Myxococcaceae bacterium]